MAAPWVCAVLRLGWTPLTAAAEVSAGLRIGWDHAKTFSQIQQPKAIAMPELKTSAAKMVAAARARVQEIETLDAIAMVDNADVVFVDLRDPRERERSGFIPGSFHCPRGMLEFWVDPESPYHKEIFGQDKKFIFHCASGWRSALSVATLQDMGFDAAHLKEGYSTWEAQGGPVAFPEKRD